MGGGGGRGGVLVILNRDTDFTGSLSGVDPATDLTPTPCFYIYVGGRGGGGGGVSHSK